MTGTTGMDKLAAKKELWINIVTILILAALIASLDGSGHWFQTWLAYLLALALASLCLYGVWRVIRPNRKATTIALVSFALRLGFGIALALLLPIVGYKDNARHMAGYIYRDAYIRDTQAWELATSVQPLTQAFSGQYTGDQYGGMLGVSALLYRLLSPDAHRPILILILGATLSAVGVLCLWKAASAWFGERTGLLISWLFALYPESILLGSSQMREAIVIPMTALAFFGLTEVQSKKWTGWLWIGVSALFLFPVQPLAGFVSFAVLFGVWLLDPATLHAPKQRQILLIVFLFVALLLVAMLVVSSILSNLPSLQGSKTLGVFLTWFQHNFAYQSYVTERSSGMFQSLLDRMGEQWRWLIVLVYGIAQPVLPAMVGDPDSAWIIRIIGILRAIGWYVLALFLVYGTLGVLRSRTETRRLQLIWLCLISWAWIMLAALNAGADLWDNPRYRVILLIWQVVLAGWAWEWARVRRDAWLWRWLAVEAVFVAMFTEWYLGRYYPGFIHLDILWMVTITLLVSALIIIAGVVWDKKHRSISLNNGL